MGCTTYVVIHGGDEAMVADAQRRVARFESLWSRFLETSDITIANRSAGMPVRVDEDTLAVVARSVAGSRQTGGAFDVTMLPTLLDHGYTHSITTSLRAPRLTATRSRAHEEIVIDFERSTLTVPVGGAIDLGGIGKGFAADVVAEDLVAEGADGVLVNIGGDIALRGQPCPEISWHLGIEDPNDRPKHVAVLHMGEGGIATSGTTIRRWVRSDGSESHHIIDPTTGRPSTAGLATVTVIAGDAATAEVFSKAAMMLDGPAAMAMLEGVGLAGLGVDENGVTHRSATLAAFER